MRAYSVLRLLSFAFVMMAFDASAQQSGRVLYVNQTDTTCGGLSPCYGTIQAAVNAAVSRDAVSIQPGIYREQVFIEKNNFPNASESDRIIIEADPEAAPGSVILTGSPGPQCTDKFAIRLKQSKFVTIRGLTITGTGAQAIFMMGGNNTNLGIHIELNRIFGNGSSMCNGGITIARNNPGTIIANNLIHANGRNGIVFHDADGGPHYVIGNTIYGNQWNGIDVARQHRVTIVNNIVNANGTAAGTTDGRFGIQRESSNKPEPQSIALLNNLICGNSRGEINGPVLDATDSGNSTPLGNEGPGVGAKPGCDDPANLFMDLHGIDGALHSADDDFSLKQGSLAIDVGIDPRTLGLDPMFDTVFISDYFRDTVFRPQDGDGDGVAEFDAGAFEFSGDVREPLVTILSPGEGAYVRQTITVTAQASDDVAVSTFTLSAAGQAIAPIIMPSLPSVSAKATALWNTTTAVDGPTTLLASATDGSGNTGNASHSIIVDNTPPQTEITGGPTGEVTQTAVTMTFAGSDNLTPSQHLVFAWRMNGGSYSSFSPDTSLTIDGLAAGSHSFEVVARDLAGNEDSSPAVRTFVVQLGPAIAAVEPVSGAIGTLVTITGNDFEPGATQVSLNGAAAVIRTITTAEITIIVPTNATTGPLTVQTSRGSASRHFTVVTSKDFNLVVGPSEAQTVQGGSVTVQIEAIPLNHFSGLIHLATGPLPTGVSAQAAPSMLAPNNYSLLHLTTTGETPVGAHAVEIRATAPIDGQTITRTANATLNISAPGQTVLIGRILDGEDRPLAGVSIKLGGATLTHLGSSDAAGNVFIHVPSPGPQVFLIDGSSANTATLNYPTVPITLDIQPGAINELGYIPRLRGQFTTKLMPIVPGQAAVITDPDLPGFKMSIPAGVEIIGWDGQPNTQFGVTAVPIDRSPLPPLMLPAGFEARETYLFSFGKVGGGVPTGNIPIDVPNHYGALPGERVDLYFFNEAPDGSAPNQWEKYGTATVSLDGTTLVTDINPTTGLPYGIPRFCCGALTPVFNFINRLFGLSGGSSDGGKTAGDPVDVSTGLFYLDKTDMILPGVLPVVITRTYRSNFTNAGPFGIGTSSSFDVSLQAPSSFNNQTIVLISPGNKQDMFSRQSDGTYVNTTAPSLRGAVLSESGSSQSVYSLKLKDGRTWKFNSLGLLISQADRNGNTILFLRDSFTRVTRIEEPAGRALTISYGTSGLGLTSIQSITDPIGRQVRYSYDSSGRLQEVIDPAGGVTRYTYDTADRIVSLRDPRGIIFLTNEYDSDGRIVRQTQADGGVWRFDYTTNGAYISQATVTNPRGYATTYRFNAAGYQVSETDALGQTTSFERQAGTNLVLSITDPLKRITGLQHDALGNLTRIVDPLGNARTFAYHPAFNTVTAIVDALGNTTSFEYDTAGNLTTITDPLGHRSTFAYNTSGQTTAMIDPLGNITTIAYDNMGNVSAVTDPLGHQARRIYDGVSRVIAHIDARGKMTSYVYDNLNRTTRVTDPGGGITQFGYDGNGNLLFVSDGRNNVTAYDYDSMDRLVSRVDPLGAVETFEYDRMGNYRRYVDRKGQETQFAHDELDRLAREDYADGARTMIVYDAVGRIVQATDPTTGMIANQYDNINRVVAQVTNQGTIGYEYDVLGRRTLMSATGQAPVAYDYDAASRLIQMVQGSRTVNFVHDDLGRRTRITLPNGVAAERQYDANSRITALTYQNAQGVLGDLTYQYDRAGNRTGIGGSFARVLLPNPVALAAYDEANRQLQFGGHTMIYDPNGNLTTLTSSTGVKTFSWDARNRLKSMVGPSGASSFTYDVVGRREKKIIYGQVTQYLYDAVNPIQESTGITVYANILAGLDVDEFFSRTDLSSGGTDYILGDALGSSVALAGAAGTIQTEYIYEPFGNTVAMGASNTNSFQYTARENDGTGLYYYRARYYHPGLHRFISEDPIGFAGGDPNLYAYVHNNPTNFRDPSGNLVPAAVVGGVLCATGAIAGASAHHVLSGRKSNFLGFLSGAATGCATGLGLGWLLGIAVESVIPTTMLAGGKASLWGGTGARGASLAMSDAAATGGATIYQTFIGSTLKFAELAGVSPSLTGLIWPHFSSQFVSGARTATVFIGRNLAQGSTFLTRELPVLQANGAKITYVFLP